MMTPIALTLENRDLIAGHRLYQRRSNWRRSTLAGAVAILILLPLVAVALNRGEGDLRIWGQAMGASLLWMGGVLLLSPRLIGWLAGRRALERQPILRREQALHWDDDGFRQFEDTGRDGQYHWTDVIELAHDPQTILLFVAPRLYVVVPRRVLRPDQAADLIAMAAAKGVPVWPQA